MRQQNRTFGCDLEAKPLPANNTVGTNRHVILQHTVRQHGIGANMAVAANADTMVKHGAGFNDAAPADFDIATDRNTGIDPDIGECRRGNQRDIRVTRGDKLRQREREIAPRSVTDNHNGIVRQRAQRARTGDHHGAGKTAFGQTGPVNITCDENQIAVTSLGEWRSAGDHPVTSTTDLKPEGLAICNAVWVKTGKISHRQP